MFALSSNSFQWILEVSSTVVVSCSSFVLQIFSYNKKEAVIPRLLFQKQLGKYEYDLTTTGGFSATLRKGSDPEVIDLACSENYIYLIVQNKKNRKMRDIEVIDWQGNPVKYLNCNKKIICLTIDKKEKKGYCVIEDPEEHLAWFNIWQLLLSEHLCLIIQESVVRIKSAHT